MYALLPSLQDETYLREKRGIEDAAQKLGNVDLTVDAGTSQIEATGLIAKLNTALTKGTDVILVNAGGVGDELTPVLERAVSEGIPVVTFDQDLPKLSRRAAYVGWDAEKGGNVSGTYLREHLPNGEVAIIRCVIGNPLSDAMEAGFRAAIAGSGLRVVSRADAKCDSAKARTIAEDAITAHPQLAAIFADVPPNAVGAVQAVKASGKKILVITDGENLATLQSVAAGEIGATSSFPMEEIGSTALDDAVDAANGKTITPAVTLAPAALIDKSNVAEHLSQSNSAQPAK